jgi:hypothetical protein
MSGPTGKRWPTRSNPHMSYPISLTGITISCQWVPPGKACESQGSSSRISQEDDSFRCQQSFTSPRSIHRPTRRHLRPASGRYIPTARPVEHIPSTAHVSHPHATSPDRKTPSIIQDAASHPRLIFSTSIRLLTMHIKRPRPLQTRRAHPKCAPCPYRLPAQWHSKTSTFSNTLEHRLALLSHIWGTTVGGAALGVYIAAPQACVQPRRAAPELGGPRVEGRAIRGQFTLHPATRYPTRQFIMYIPQRTNRAARRRRRPTPRDIMFIFEVDI